MAELTDRVEDYTLLAVIGKGCNGAASISAAKHTVSGTFVAVKRFHLDRIEQCNHDLQLIQHEILMSRKHCHQNILPVCRSFVHRNEIWAVSPLMGYGSCKDLIHAHFSEGLSETAVAFILRDVLSALEYLHLRGIVHRSVKASHITVSALGSVCLSGLKHSICILERGNRCRNIHDFPEQFVSSLLWASPELLEQNMAGYNTKSDIYSVGITACELANGVVPFSDMPTTQMLLEKIEGTKPRLLDSTTIPELQMDGPEDVGQQKLPYHRTFSQHFHNFVDACLQSDSSTRPTASQLLQHSFFKQIRRRSNTEVSLPQLLRPVQPLTDIMANLPQESKCKRTADGVVLSSLLAQANGTFSKFGREEWPNDTILYQPFEAGQILLPEFAVCLGVKAFLRMCHLKYSVVMKTNAEQMSPSGKLPFLKVGSVIVSEPEPIMNFAKNKGHCLSEHLTDIQNVEMKAYISLVESALVQAELYLTWHDKTMYKRVTSQRYGNPFPWPLNHLLPLRKKWDVEAALKANGWANKTTEKVCQDVETCCQALSQKLGDQVYMFGDKPTELDAIVYGHLYTILTIELPFSEFAKVVNGFDNLVKFCKRIDMHYFKQYVE